jgi:hypothetical protein
MKREPVIFLVTILFVVCAAVFAGCTSPPDILNKNSSPLYQTGDVISNTSQNNYGLAIRSYDPQSDNYTYSIVSRSKNGNWNYLPNREIMQDKHTAIETVLPYKITHIDDFATLEIKSMAIVTSNLTVTVTTTEVPEITHSWVSDYRVRVD